MDWSIIGSGVAGAVVGMLVIHYILMRNTRAVFAFMDKHFSRFFE